jgi:hypothetical protein
MCAILQIALLQGRIVDVCVRKRRIVENRVSRARTYTKTRARAPKTVVIIHASGCLHDAVECVRGVEIHADDTTTPAVSYIHDTNDLLQARHTRGSLRPTQLSLYCDLGQQGLHDVATSLPLHD